MTECSRTNGVPDALSLVEGTRESGPPLRKQNYGLELQGVPIVGAPSVESKESCVYVFMRLWGGGLFSVTAFVWFLPLWLGEPHAFPPSRL